MEHTAIEHVRRLARWCGHLWAHRTYEAATRGLTSPLDIARAVDKASPDVLRPAELALPEGILCPAMDSRACYVHESARKRIRWEVEPDPPLGINPRTVVWIQSGSTSWHTPGVAGAVATLVVRRCAWGGDGPACLEASLDIIADPRADTRNSQSRRRSLSVWPIIQPSPTRSRNSAPSSSDGARRTRGTRSITLRKQLRRSCRLGLLTGRVAIKAIRGQKITPAHPTTKQSTRL